VSALLKVDSLDEVEGGEEVEGVMSDLLFDPLVKNCLGGKREFQFDETRVMFARRRPVALIIGLYPYRTF
jgi:hypothetical protein